MIAVIWDKKTPINGVSAETYLQNNPHIANDDLILVMDESTNKVVRVESAQILKTIANIKEDLSPIEIFNEFERLMEEQRAQNLDKITQLEKENAEMMYALMMGGLI
ncbi:hypothetical protein [Geobacillus stearothermophilus]|uniref:hypothetical protein n=1 Tax=Geobacillus stearothermophilus TaxID=1422 RepID=UPI003D218F13